MIFSVARSKYVTRGELYLGKAVLKAKTDRFETPTNGLYPRKRLSSFLPAEPSLIEPLPVSLRAASMLLNAFLLGTLDKDSYIRFAVWAGIATFMYVVYGVHASWRQAEKLEMSPEEATRELEMEYVEQHKAGDA